MKQHSAWLLLAVCSTVTAQELLEPPVAPVQPREFTLHGEKLVDPYYYLREKTNPEVLRYLEKENAYTEAMMKSTEALQEKLYQEILGRIKQTDLSVPSFSNGYWYYSRTVEGQQYPLYCRKKGTLEAAEEIMLDVNELAKPYKFFSVAHQSVSDDNRYLAYTFDTTGFREYTLAVKDLQTGEYLKDSIKKVYSPTWSSDGNICSTPWKMLRSAHTGCIVMPSGPSPSRMLCSTKKRMSYSGLV